MNNEKLETSVSAKRKSSKILFIVLGLIILGIIALFGGINILSKFSISADTGLPPMPGDPVEEPTATATATYSVASSATSTSTYTATSTPNSPDDPVGPPIDVTIKAGWSLISGTTLYNFDVSPITQKGIYFYSFNDPFVSNRNWVVSSLNCAGQKDYFCTSLNQKFSPWPYVGYYLYNPGSEAKVTLNQVSSNTYKQTDAIFGRGWHLVQWRGPAATRADVLRNVSINYNDSTGLNLMDAISEANHRASTKIYVIMNPSSITSSAVKELADYDSDTTISKIPADTYFWVYLRRTMQRATQISAQYTSSATALPVLPNQSAIDKNTYPPVPPSPN